jgi:ketosteroid isomerase-like protein
VTEALSGAIERAHARLAEGVAEAERELVIARQRCKELQREMAVAKARAGYELEVPERMAIPDVDLTTLEVRWPDAEAGAEPLMSSMAPPRAEPPAEAPPAVPPAITEIVELAGPTELTCDSLRPEWRHSLSALVRCDVAMFPEVFARNVIVRWEGDNPLAGTHLGDKQALPVLERLAASIQPGSALVDELRETDGNLEATAVVTFVGDIPDHVELATRIRCVFRFDDNGRIALFFATPEELDVVDGFLILVEEGDPDAGSPAER